jgi:hypothetical protein
MSTRYVHVLKGPELRDLLRSPHARTLILGGEVDFIQSQVVVYTGDCQKRVIPFTWFQSEPGEPPPNFHDFEVVDFGRAIRLGGYKTSADPLLEFFLPMLQTTA